MSDGRRQHLPFLVDLLLLYLAASEAFRQFLQSGTGVVPESDDVIPDSFFQLFRSNPFAGTQSLTAVTEGYLAIAAIVNVSLTTGTFHPGAVHVQAAQPTLDQTAQKVMPLGRVSRNQDIGPQGFLGLLPGGLIHNLRNRSDNDVPLFGAPLPIVVLAFVDRIDNHASDPARTPEAGRGFLSFPFRAIMEHFSAVFGVCRGYAHS